MVNPRNSRYSRALLGFTLRILRYSRALWGLNPRNLRYSRALLGLSPRILRYSRALVGLNLRNLRYSRALLGFNLRNLFNLEHSGPPDCLGPDLAADAFGPLPETDSCGDGGLICRNLRAFGGSAD